LSLTAANNAPATRWTGNNERVAVH